MNCLTISLKPIGVEDTSVSQYLPGLRDDFLVPEADLASLRYQGVLGTRTITDAVLLTRNGKYVAFELPDDARQAFRGLCEALLDSRFPEWAQAEGAEGAFLWDLASDSLTHKHSLRCLCEHAPKHMVALPRDSSEWPEKEIPF